MERRRLIRKTRSGRMSRAPPLPPAAAAPTRWIRATQPVPHGHDEQKQQQQQQLESCMPSPAAGLEIFSDLIACKVVTLQ